MNMEYSGRRTACSRAVPDAPCKAAGPEHCPKGGNSFFFRQVFTEVARMAYANVKGEQANHLMRKIPYTIIPGEEGKLRKDIFLERAIVEERVRLAMGLPTRRMDEHNSVVSGFHCR